MSRNTGPSVERRVRSRHRTATMVAMALLAAGCSAGIGATATPPATSPAPHLVRAPDLASGSSSAAAAPDTFEPRSTSTTRAAEPATTAPIGPTTTDAPTTTNAPVTTTAPAEDVPVTIPPPVEAAGPGAAPATGNAVSAPVATPPHRDPTVPTPTTSLAPAPYWGTISEIDDATAERMAPEWHSGCPVALADLRLLTLAHWDFQGVVTVGELIVHAGYAEDVVAVFEQLFRAGFPIQRMDIVSVFDGDDNASMEANNTSAHNCRTIAGTSTWSEHAYGRAIDINPVQNPYVSGTTVLPPDGAAYVDRTGDHPGMIHDGDVVVQAFTSIAWFWGGYWSSIKDYQHFSATGN